MSIKQKAKGILVWNSLFLACVFFCVHLLANPQIFGQLQDGCLHCSVPFYCFDSMIWAHFHVPFSACGDAPVAMAMSNIKSSHEMGMAFEKPHVNIYFQRYNWPFIKPGSPEWLSFQCIIRWEVCYHTISLFVLINFHCPLFLVLLFKN